MNAIDDMTGLMPLEVEWDRVEALALCLVETRQGREPPAELIDMLADLQAKVLAIRQPPSPWQVLPVDELTTMELDILAVVASAELQPRVGWLFQTLQGGTPHASPALVQDLLALRGGEVVELRRALAPGSPLIENRVVSCSYDDPYAPLRFDPRPLARLMGWRDQVVPPPGATLVRLLADWDALVLPDLQRRMLREFLFWVRGRSQVVGAWGGRDVGGPLALFSGPSGTGKTFAASVVATDLGWPLYRVDLGQIVSKYVGETEKNLNAMFDAAHGREMVLQFDEADALLGKRAEVKEARDRYANMEVSHLLSRIEQHRGPCVLTTNLRTDLDSAFLRRFQAVIEFPRPDVAARTALWDRLLPPGAPRTGRVDTEVLGRAVAMTGGGIQNAALHAAYLAAAGQRAIDLDHLATAVWRELGKSGKPLARKELGPLADHLPPDELMEGGK